MAIRTNIDINQLADFMLLYCNMNDISINHFKLQKLLYYTQAWHMVYFDKAEIFTDEPEAWVNGPVYRQIYDTYKNSLANVPLNYSLLKGKSITLEDSNEQLGLSNEQNNFLYAILNHYGLMSHEKLILLTHREKPWREARSGLGEFEYSTKKISKDTMYKYYESLNHTTA